MNENKVSESAYNYGRDSGYAAGFVDGYKAGVKDAEPKKGRWVETIVRSSTALCCSNCGQDSGSLYRYNYCPNCGAEMSEIPTDTESEDKE